MVVSKILKKQTQQLVTCRPEDTLQTVATILTTKNIGELPVCDERGAMIRIISERDLVMAFAGGGGEINSLRDRDINQAGPNYGTGHYS